MAEIPLQWKLSIQGAEDVKSKLQDIQNQFARGEISTQEYGKGLREVNRDARTFTRQADIQKNVFLAQYPAINQLSRGLSSFNSVASSGLSIMNSLNLMFLRQGQDTTELAKINSDIAATQRELNAAVKAGDWSKVEELKSKLQQLQNTKDSFLKDADNRKLQDFANGFLGVSFGVSTLTGAVIKALPQIKSLAGLLTSAQFAENFAIGLAGIRAGLTALLGPIAILAAALYGVTELLGVLMPKEFKELIDRIKKEYNVDDITAHLIAPFEIWKIGILEVIVPAIVNGLNAMIDGINMINPFGKIAKIQYTMPKNPLDVTDQYLADQFGSKGAGKSKTQEMIDQQKTTNSFAEDTKKQADQMLDSWKNTTNPIITDTLNQTKTSTKILYDTYSEAKTQTLALTDIAENNKQALKATLSMPMMQLGVSASLGERSGAQVIDILHGGIDRSGQYLGSNGKYYSDAATAHKNGAASGFEGYVNSPTTFMVGEAGGEYVSVTPHGKSNGMGQPIIINVQGSVISERELMRIINSRLKSDFQGRNWTNLG